MPAPVVSPQSAAVPRREALRASLIAISLAALAGCGAPPDDSAQDSEAREAVAPRTESQPIVGGRSSYDYRAVGHIEYRSLTGTAWARCTGTLISANTFLTAAHCFVKEERDAAGNCTGTFTRRVDPAAWKVGFGWYEEGTPYAVSQILVHPSYRNEQGCEGTSNSAHDMAVVVLSRNVHGIYPHRVATPGEYASDTYSGRPMKAVGYGRNTATAEPSDTPTHAYRKEADTEIHGVRTNHQIETRARPGASDPGNVCSGDSGGPLLTPNGSVVYGVASRGSADCTTLARYAAFGNPEDYNWVTSQVALYAPRPGSSPAAVSWGGDRIDLFMLDAEGKMLHRYYSGGIWRAWESISPHNERFICDPAVASWGPGRLDVFTCGPNYDLQHKWFDNNGWSNWESLGGGLTSSPAAISTTPGGINVVVRGTDHAIHHRGFANNTWHGWESLGGGLSTGPAICSWGGRLDVFASGLDRNLYQKVWEPSRGWHGWYQIPGHQVASDPACMSLGYNNLNVFYRGSDNAFVQAYWGGAGWGSNWFGGSLGGNVEAISWQGGVMAFALGSNGVGPWAKSWMSNTGWSGWTYF